MPRLPKVSGEEAIGALERLGFARVRQRGSHVVLKKQTDDGEIGCVVPLHPELAKGTLRSILRQADVTTDATADDLVEIALSLLGLACAGLSVLYVLARLYGRWGRGGRA